MEQPEIHRAKAEYDAWVAEMKQRAARWERERPFDPRPLARAIAELHALLSEIEHEREAEAVRQRMPLIWRNQYGTA